MTAEASIPRVTVVVPLLNEDESLPELHNQIRSVLAAEEWTYELIFVDDGSRDDSLRVLNDIASRDENVRVIAFRRNYGKSAALATGFRAARGVYVITMDADLQDNPQEIPALVARLEDGYDLVSGWKKKRYDPVSKRWPSKFFNAMTGWLSGIRLHDFNCGLKAYRSEVVKELPVYGELHRFLPVLAHKLGFRVTEMVVAHRARKYGHSKFGARRFLNGFFDLLTVLFISNFTRAPLHLFGLFGLIGTGLGFIINLYLTIGKLMGIPIGNRPLLFLGVLLMVVGVQFFFFGLIAEMLANSRERDRMYSIKQDSGVPGKARPVTLTGK